MAVSVLLQYDNTMKVHCLTQFSERDIHRFWSYVGLPDSNGCMNWLGSRFKDKRGKPRYGCFSTANHPALAHRVAYVLANGEIPDDLTIDHICENLACEAPDHLQLLTNTQNALKGTCEDETGERCVKGHNDWSIRARQRVCRECYREYRLTWRRNG